MSRRTLLALPGARPAVLLATLAAAPALAGCYTARPLALGGPLPVGQRVEVELTSRGGAELTPILGPQVERVEGEVVRAVRDTVELAVRRAERFGNREDTWQGQRIAIPASAIERVSERRLDRKRSWLVAAGITLAAIAVGGIVRGGGQVPVGGGTVSPPN